MICFGNRFLESVYDVPGYFALPRPPGTPSAGFVKVPGESPHMNVGGNVVDSIILYVFKMQDPRTKVECIFPLYPC